LKFSKEAKTGALVVIAILLLIFGYNYLKGQNLLDRSRTFYAVYDNVEGLAPGSNVTVNGLPVGKVLGIDFKGNKGLLVVTFDVQKDFKFSKNSIARIYGGGFLGGKSLAIVPTYELGMIAKSGDTLKSDIEDGVMELVNKRLAPLQEKIEDVISDTDSVITSVNKLLDEKTRLNLQRSIASFAKISKELEGTSANVNRLLANNEQKFNTSMSNVETASANFARMSDTLATIELAPLINQMENALTDFEQVAARLNNGEGTVGKLLEDDQLYVNLERSSRQMEQLIQDLKLNPKRYVHFSLFGKKPKQYTPPKDSLR